VLTKAWITIPIVPTLDTSYIPESKGGFMAFTATDPIKMIFAVILPPVGVFLEVGFKGHFWLNIILTLFGFIPGIIHAFYVILKH
jgi:uncharacterized membrane protein YqaE (UPF0057 family)